MQNSGLGVGAWEPRLFCKTPGLWLVFALPP